MAELEALYDRLNLNFTSLNSSINKIGNEKNTIKPVTPSPIPSKLCFQSLVGLPRQAPSAESMWPFEPDVNVKCT